MASNHKSPSPLLYIDLNVEFTNPEIDDENSRQQNANEIYPHLPNCIIAGENFDIDLNQLPNSPPFEPYVDIHAENSADEDMESEFEINNNDGFTNLEDSQVPRRRIKLSDIERRTIYQALLEKSVDGKLKKGTTTLVATQFLVNIHIVQRIWKLAENEGIHADVSNRKVGNSGRKRIQLDFDQVRDIPLHKRTTIRFFASAWNISKSTLFRCLKSRDIRRHTNAIKPFLTEENKRARLRFCISMLDNASIPHDPTFLGMCNIIHIDEKWFYMSKKSKNFYLLQDEQDLIRTCKSKNFIAQVMFLVVMAHPRFDQQGNERFSGKIGVYPFVTQEPTKRTSVNRAVGTLETKPIQSVNKEVIRKFLLEKVLPDIKEKWPQEEMGHPIYIQQDNAKTHVDSEDEEFCRAASQDGFDIRLMRQPPNSPDLNVLDIGSFSAIQSLQHQESPKSIDEFVSAVKRSFEEFSTIKSNQIFLTLQSCMVEIMKARGSHNYKIPHLKKATLETQNQLPIQLKCDPTLVQDVLSSLN